AQPKPEAPAPAAPTTAEQPKPAASVATPPAAAPQAEPSKRPAAQVHAGPAVRKLAREFGVDRARVSPAGPHDRVLKEDVQAYVKAMMQQTQAAPGAVTGGAGIPPIPAVDFSKFGEIEEVPMTRLMQRSEERRVGKECRRQRS